jgi:sugar lactone lactonase YvrE
VRVAAGRATNVASGLGIYHVTVANGRTYVSASDGAVYRVDGSAFTRVTPPVDAGAAAVDAAGNVYVAVYAGWIKKITSAGVVTNLAGTGVEGYAGDGGAATAAKLFHPHALALGPDGALYVADTENRRIRRIDLHTGTIATFGGDVGITVSVAVASDGTVWSADVRRDGTGSGGITRTTAQGVTSRVATLATANGVAVAPDGTVYVNQWESKRVGRLDPRSGMVEPVARGKSPRGRNATFAARSSTSSAARRGSRTSSRRRSCAPPASSRASTASSRSSARCSRSRARSSPRRRAFGARRSATSSSA